MGEEKEGHDTLCLVDVSFSDKKERVSRRDVDEKEELANRRKVTDQRANQASRWKGGALRYNEQKTCLDDVTCLILS